MPAANGATPIRVATGTGQPRPAGGAAAAAVSGRTVEVRRYEQCAFLGVARRNVRASARFVTGSLNGKPICKTTKRRRKRPRNLSPRCRRARGGSEATTPRRDDVAVLTVPSATVATHSVRRVIPAESALRAAGVLGRSGDTPGPGQGARGAPRPPP